MTEVPAGALSRPLLVSLTDLERAEIKKKQDETTDRGVVGRTKPIQEMIRFSNTEPAGGVWFSCNRVKSPTDLHRREKRFRARVLLRRRYAQAALPRGLRWI